MRHRLAVDRSPRLPRFRKREAINATVFAEARVRVGLDASLMIVDDRGDARLVWRAVNERDRVAILEAIHPGDEGFKVAQHGSTSAAFRPIAVLIDQRLDAASLHATR